VRAQQRKANIALYRIGEDATFLWLWRAHHTSAPNVRLIDLVRLDERVEAHVDSLRIGGAHAWKLTLELLDGGAAGAFFVAGMLAIENSESAAFDGIIERAFDAAQRTELEPYEPVYDPWRGLVSALAWMDSPHAARVIEWLSQTPRPRMRWLGIAACGARRSLREPLLERALTDADPLVRARSYRTTGELGCADLTARLALGFKDGDSECRFWSAWAAARMGAREPLDALADIAWQNGPRAEQALDLLLRRLDVPQANAWLRELAPLPERRRSVIRATGVIGDPIYIPWLIDRMDEPAAARLAGEAFSMITGVDLAYRDLDRRPTNDFQSGPNDDAKDENVALDEDERLPWPDPAKVADWWTKNKARFNVGTAYFLGKPKASADWLEALSDAFQRQRRAAALELAIRQPNKAMFEVRARGRLQRQLIARARGRA
jgi:uncharacterized protein (TIGR02270 family)